MKPSQVSRSRPQHVVVFGDPKTGKSTLVAKLLLQGYNLTWISMDNGHEVLFKMGLSPEFLDEHLNIILVPDTKENPVAIATCLKIISGAKVTICDKHGRVECPVCKRTADATWTTVECNAFGSKDVIVFDHLGQLATSAMTHAFIRAKKDEEEKPEWEQYANQGFLMDKFMTNVQQAPYNVVCITHVTEAEMDDGKKKFSPMMGTTNFSRNAGKYFDHMVYCQMMNRDHRFGSMTKYAANVITGSRGDKAIEDDKEQRLSIFFDGTVTAPVPPSSEVLKKILKTSEKAPATLEGTLEPETFSPAEKEVLLKFDNTENPPAPAIPAPAPAPAPAPSVTIDRAELLSRLRRR